MHAHRVKVFNGANHHEVVAKIAHDFKFVLFPAEDGFFHKRFVNRAHIERVGNRVSKFFAVVGNRAAGAAKRERRTNHQRKAKLLAKTHRILSVVDESGGRNFEADFAAGILEPEAVFRDFYRAKRRANHFYFVFFKDAAFGEFDG